MQKWEYLRIGISHDSYENKILYISGNYKKIMSDIDRSALVELLTKLGSEGWELVTTQVWSNGYDEAYFFKRPIN